MHHAFKLGDNEHNVELSRTSDGYRLHIGGMTVPVDLKTSPDGRHWLTVDGQSSEALLATRGDAVFIHVDGQVYRLDYEHPLDRLAHQSQAGADDRVLAPMPGSLVAVSVTPGDAVSKGQTLLVMESMKMETTIMSPRDGVIAAVNFEKGQSFDRDAALLTLEPQS